ncbi:transposase [Salmonella enterica]|nr:transposase [Salmonella enterica]
MPPHISREQKERANSKKARIRQAALRERVANARTDFQYKLSRTIVDENKVAIVEARKTANMVKDYSLARAMGDAGWNGFIIKL